MTGDQALIAIIDSDDSWRARLRILLEAEGLKIELFKSAEEYLKRSKSHSPNCIVLDVRLPGISGLDLQSRQEKTRRKTPLVFLTAQNEVRTSVRAMKAGAIDFLTKPFQDEELLDAVRSGIERDLAARLQKQTLDELRTRLASLSPRERETMVLLSAGQGPKQIAGQLRVCTQTARVHSGRVMAKMGARSIADLVRMVDRLEHLSREGEELRIRINTKCRVINRGGATVRRSDAHTYPDGHSVGSRGQFMPPVPSLS
ncbi:MAG TPA: response regulator [Terriglobales bacterium]|jgi:FixJ family two-component response regulator|nr:response regulator [Terriglobales bacterium]